MTAVEELRANVKRLISLDGGYGYVKVHTDDLRAFDAALDAALAEIERMTPKFVAYDYLESPAGREIAEARATALEKALEPFAWFGEKNTDSTGWAGLRCERERINVWFGPSDFRNAFEAASLSPKEKR
jgi:hypothetical protein